VSKLIYRLALAAAFVSVGAAAQTPQWRAVQELRLGAVEGPAHLAFSPGLVVRAAPDGTLYVADPGTKQVRVFDQRGRHLRSFGGQGAGPGEFLSIGEAGWRGDTLWVTDPMQLRTTFFTPAGRDVRTLGAVTRATGELTPTGAWVVLADGSVLALPGGVRREDGRPATFRLPLLRVEPRTGRTDTIAWRELRNRMLRVEDGGRLLSIVQPWDDTPLFAVSAIGAMMVQVDRAVSDRGQPVFRVTRFDTAGRQRFSRVFRYSPVPLPANWRSQWAMEKAREIAAWRPVGSVRTLAAAIAGELFSPVHMPPVTAVVAGTDGSVWLRREERGGDTVEWLVLDGEGRVAGVVRLPVGLAVQQATRTRVWGVMDDDLDVPHVYRFRVEPTRR
jgi:hypothetical protein